MAPQRPHDVDRKVRESFGLEPAAVRRIVAGAQAVPAAQPRRGWSLRTAVATGAVLVVAAAAAWWSRPPEMPAPVDASLSWSLSGDLLVVAWPDGSTSILGPDRSEERPPDGFGIVMIDGGHQ